MPKRAVFTDVMDVLERRVAAGEFMLRDIPGERKLAVEVGVSYMTARKAVLALIEKQVLMRRENGSLAVHPRFLGDTARCQVALLTPAYPSAHLVRCRLAVSQAASAHDVQFRPFEYMYWQDAVVSEALEGSDGLLVIPSTEPIPPRTLKAFSAAGARVVFLDSDMSEHGLPSIRFFAKEHIVRLFEHLWDLGHRRIDCLNTQGHSEEIDRRVAHWRDWTGERACTGVLWDDPARPHEDMTARAHRTMGRILTESAERPSAVLCTTQPAALGAIRACRDAGVEVGTEISICTVNNEPTGRYFCPSLTGLEMPDIGSLLERCFSWFDDKSLDWEGPKRIVPSEPTIFLGESTGPAPR